MQCSEVNHEYNCHELRFIFNKKYINSMMRILIFLKHMMRMFEMEIIKHSHIGIVWK